MTTNRPEFKAHDDFIFEHKEVGKVTREEFIKYIRSSHEHMRKLSQIIQQYNQTIDEYLNEWDGQFESFDEDVKDLLGRWIQDGTIDHIINENLMSIKADKEYVDELHDSTTAQLAQTETKKLDRNENESITKAMLSQEIKDDLASGEWDFSVNMSELEYGSVSLPKINEPYGILPKGVKLTREADVRRARSSEFYLQKGDTIYATGDTSMTLSTTVDGEITGTVISGWIKEHTFAEDGTYLIRARFDDDRSLVSTIENLKSKIYIITKETGVKIRELNDFKEELVDEGVLPTPIENGSISTVTGENYDDTLYRSRSETFLDFPEGSTVRLLNTEDFDMGVYVEGTSRFVSGWSTVNYTSNKDERIRLSFKKDDDSLITDDDLKELGKSFELITPDRIVRHRQITTSNQGEVVRYVTLEGNDNNNGGSVGNAYATLQKAFNDNPRIIYVERRIYYGQTASISNAKDLTILPLDMGEYTSGTPLQAIEFRGSDLLENWETYNGIYRTTYNGNARYDQVFISKTLDAEQGRSYNAPLWEVIDREEDYLLKPVMTISEVESEQGTFHYDGTHVYINPLNIDNEFHAVALDTVINISGDSVKLVDFNASFCRYSPLDLDNIKHLTAHNCEANYSYMSDGFSLDYTNGTLTDCRATKNINDGFNMHYYGDTTLINCSGINNFDDGVSHHEYCTGVIIGGVWSGNGKAGIAPVNHAQVNTYNALIEGNRVGIYNIGIDNTVTNISQGNVLKDNESRFRNSNAVLLSLNDTSINNGNDEGATPVTEY